MFLLDTPRREIHIQIGPFLTVERQARSVASPERRIPLWEVPGIASALARSGWRVVFLEGSEDVLRMGRGVSVLTGHVSARPSMLWKPRKRLP